MFANLLFCITAGVSSYTYYKHNRKSLFCQMKNKDYLLFSLLFSLFMVYYSSQ